MAAILEMSLKKYPEMPAYYYMLKAVTYTRQYTRGNSSGDQQQQLVVTLRMLLVRAGGLMPIYGVRTFPVPITSK